MGVKHIATLNIYFYSLNLEALSVHDGWSGFIVLLLGDPHLLEGGERSQDGASDPYGILSLWWRNDLDLHGWWSKSCDFLLHSVSDAYKKKQK